MTWLARMTPMLLRGAAVAACIGLLLVWGPLEGMERRGLNLLFHLRGPLAPQTPLVIVSIDEDSFDELNLNWPWPRSLHAQFLDIVNRGKPAAVGFDLLFAEPSARGPDDDLALADAVGRAGNVVLAAALTVTQEYFYSKQDLNAPLPDIRDRARGFGTVNFIVDDDAYVRRADLDRLYQEKPLPNFDLELYRLAVARGMPAAPIQDQRFLINYRGGVGTFATVPYHRVLRGEVPPEVFAGRIVLVGATSPVLHDLYPTPFARHGDMPGVEIHANVLETLLQGIPIQRSPRLLVAADILAAGLLAVWATNRLRPLTGLVVILGIAAAHVAAVFGLFLWQRVWLDAISVPAALVLGYGATALENFIREQRQRALLMNLFARHVSSEVADAIWEHRDQFMDGGRLRSQKLLATILMTDLVGYTSVSERLDPQELLDWLNAYMETMVVLVIQHRGVVDDYAGDAIKADFGVPVPRTTEAEIKKDVLNAVSCALCMEREVIYLNQSFQGRQMPRVAMRVGIATGTVVAGSMGGSDRLKYTTIGDIVNVAARLESFQKELVDPMVTPCRILIDETTAAYVEKEVRLERMGEAHLKGKEQGRVVYRVLGWTDRGKAVEAGVQSRRAARVKAPGLVSISDEHMTIHIPFGDVSQTGLSVLKLPNKLPESQVVRMSFRLPTIPHPLNTTGRVAWSVEDRAGVQFLEIQQEDKERIEQFVAEQEQAGSQPPAETEGRIKRPLDLRAVKRRLRRRSKKGGTS